jgi:hypothetical protein
MISSNPTQKHYATAMPIYYKGTKSGTLKAACYTKVGYNEYGSYNREASQYNYFSAQGGGSQEEVESYAIRECERLHNTSCIIALYNNIERCEATFEKAFERMIASYQTKNKQLKDTENKALQLEQDVEKNNKIEKYNFNFIEAEKKCAELGFKAKSEKFADCVIKLSR